MVGQAEVGHGPHLPLVLALPVKEMTVESERLLPEVEAVVQEL